MVWCDEPYSCRTADIRHFIVVAFVNAILSEEPEMHVKNRSRFAAIELVEQMFAARFDGVQSLAIERLSSCLETPLR